ncbi:MAG: hypothetical protein V4694_04780 [Pseudomonadota bacterium]
MKPELNAEQNNQILSELFDAAFEIQEMYSNTSFFKKTKPLTDFDELLKKQQDHSLVEDIEGNLGSCFSCISQSMNAEPDVTQRKKLFKLAQELIRISDPERMSLEDHYEIMGGIVNSSTAQNDSYTRDPDSTISGIIIELLEAEFKVTHRVIDKRTGRPLKDILIFASEQVSPKNPQPDMTAIVRAILATREAPEVEGALSDLALFMIDKLGDKEITARFLEKKEVFRNPEIMTEILHAYRKSSGITDEEYDTLRNQLETNFGTIIPALAEEDLTVSSQVKIKPQSQVGGQTTNTSKVMPALVEDHIDGIPTPKPSDAKTITQKGKGPSCSIS